jgi:hypothetical protein
MFVDVTDEPSTGRLHPTDVARRVTTLSGRDVYVYDVAALVERGVHNIQFAHEKDPGADFIDLHFGQIFRPSVSDNFFIPTFWTNFSSQHF